MQETQPIDPTRCPLCGQSNQCAGQLERMTGIPQPACWCKQVTFGAELLARVPEPARRQACICVACAQAASR
ncbi:MAG: cysteine-rich CWC family protein [Rhodoferax sp.]|uniref:cysteine-rich CWC family protein n=1 Tax=Rhodoferax sp. TaxID=50421 RepID=UPI0014007120|nr:cysteine-rich CWC family protein [Rhodoferax sp.]NDP37879.1 cysteine-rich CWC family protein [Rhodoferax sp.]